MHACESVKRINHACIRAEGNVVAHTFSQSNSASPQEYSKNSVWMSGWPFHRRDVPAPSSTRGHRMVGHLVDSPVDSALFNIDRGGGVDHWDWDRQRVCE